MTRNSSELIAMVDVAVDAARSAGRYALEQINSAKSGIKAGRELVTQVDSACQAMIIERIKKSYPDHGFLGEEGQNGSCLKVPPTGPGQYWWVIDPIDGTNNYAHKMFNFGLSIAVMQNGRPVVGVIYEPITSSMFTAYEAGSAMLNGEVIRVSQENISRFASIGIDLNFENAIPQPIQDLTIKTRSRNFGAATLHFAYVAKGSLIACILTGPKLWDFAAGAIIIECAGGTITDWNFNQLFPIDLASYEPAVLRVVAANAACADELKRNMLS